MKDFLPIVKLACLTAAAALIVSCGGGADYRNVLPADSFVTMSVDAASLLKKSGTCDAASNPLLDRLKAELDKAEELSAEEKEYLFSLLENPAESGLDLKKELFLFMSADGADINNPEVGGGLLFPVGDKSKLDALIARINEKSGTETVTEAGVSVVKIGEEPEASGVCAYNDIACLLYFKTDPCGVVEEKVRKLFAQKRAESLMGDKAVAARLAARNDVNMVVSYANLSAMMNNPMLGAMPMMDVLKGALVMGSANFEKGRIVSDAAVSYKDKASVEKAAAFYAYVKPQTGDLLCHHALHRLFPALLSQRRNEAMSRKKKENAAQSTRQLMGIDGIKDYCIATRMGDLVFFIIKPTNISVLSDSSISARIYALLNVVKGQAEIEMLALNSKESFERNKNFYQERMGNEELPAIRRLLEQDSKHLDRIQVLMASSREFYIIIRLRSEKETDVFPYLSRIEQSINDNGFTTRRATEQDLKRMLGVYFEQNVTTEKFEDYDGDRWVIVGE